MTEIRQRYDQADWPGIEEAYCGGRLSKREISRQFSIPYSTMIRYAGLAGWDPRRKSLAAQVAARAKSKVMVAQAEAEGQKLTDLEIVERAATKAAEVQHLHRRDIAGLRDTVATLAGQICLIPGTSDRIGAVRDLAMALARLIPLERQAWSLDEGTGEDDPIEMFYAQIARSTLNNPMARLAGQRQLSRVIEHDTDDDHDDGEPTH